MPTCNVSALDLVGFPAKMSISASAFVGKTLKPPVSSTALKGQLKKIFLNGIIIFNRRGQDF